MKLAKLSMLSATALLAAGMSFAVAQSNMAPAPSAGAAAPQAKCWDSASNQIKDKKSGSTASGEKKPGDVTTGSAAGGSAPPSSSASVQRPAAAAGLPNC